jgi:V8-like Glu-specific endopeptidase
MNRTSRKPAYSRLKYCALLAGGILAGASLSLQTAAAQNVVFARNVASAASVAAYWTPERMKSAVSLDVVSTGTPAAASTAAAPKGTAKHSAGSPPTVEVGDALKTQLFTPETGKATDATGADTTNYGTYPFLFTTGRVFPNNAVKAYPNRAAGKLFFSDTVHGGNFVCSASAIKYRVVVTAGHCVYHGSTLAGTRHFYSNILYVPAYINGNAPFKAWPWATAVTTVNWAFSGSVPNVQDVAMIEVQDVVINTVTRRLGEVTGWLGWWTLWGRSYPNHVTQLGYPCNLDSCQMMQINNAQGVRIVSNNVEIGSAMQGGSSGGPWIQDHGVYPAGGPAYTAGNWVLGVTSYQYLGTPSPMVLGASIFQNAGYAGGGFGDLWNYICARRVGNC